MVSSILFPSVKSMRQEMLIKEGYQVLHNCAFVQDSWEEKELNIKPKTLEEIRTELGVCRSPVFCCNSQLSGGDNYIIIIMKFQVCCWIYKRRGLIIVAWKLVLFVFLLAWLYSVHVIHSFLLAVVLFQCCIYIYVFMIL